MTVSLVDFLNQLKTSPPLLITTFVMTMLSATVAETIYNMVDFGGDTRQSLVALCAALFAIVIWAVGAWAKEFLPPIEREDIISLAHKIDNVTDAVEDVLIRLDIFNVKKLHKDILKFSKLIVVCCTCMNECMEEFKHFKKSSKLLDKIIELNRLEEDGDILFTNSVRELFKHSKDPVELLIWTDILSRFERCYDACEDVADDIETIVMKNS